MRCSIFCGIGGILWAGREVPGVPTTLVHGRLGLGVGVKTMPSWAAEALLEELIVPVWIAVKGRCGCGVAGESADLLTRMGSCWVPTRSP